MTSRVGEPLIPIFFSGLPNETPGSSRITRNAETPFARNAGSLVAKTTYAWDTPAPVMKRFVPLRTTSSPSRSYRVVMAAASEPAPASVSAYDIRMSPRQMPCVMERRCSSVPASISGITPSFETIGVSETPAETRESSSMNTPNASAPPPEPPSASG